MYYHYTSLETFLKILQEVDFIGGEPVLFLRATRIDLVNDPTEMLVRQQKIVEVLKEYERQDENAFKINLSSEIDKLSHSEFRDLLAIEKSERSPYVMCFSKGKDYLPMWSLYGDKHHGVSMCFCDDIDSKIRELNHDRLIITGDVDYCYNVSSTIFSSPLELFYNQCKGGVIDDLTEDIRELLLEISPFVKDSCYEYEKEHRICIFPYEESKDNYCTEYKNDDEYILVPLPLTALRTITLGKKMPYEIIRKFLREYFKELKCDIDIDQSSIPFK